MTLSSAFDQEMRFVDEGGAKTDGVKLFSRACCVRTRGDGFKLKGNQLGLDMRRCFCNAGGEALAQVVVAAPSLRVSKVRFCSNQVFSGLNSLG